MAPFRNLFPVLLVAVSLFATGAEQPVHAQQSAPPGGGGSDSAATGAAIGIGITILAPLIIEGIRRSNARQEERTRQETRRPPPPPVRHQVPRKPAQVASRGPVYIALPDPAPLPPLYPQQVVPAQDDAIAPFLPGQIVVALGAGAGADTAQQIADDFGLTVLRETALNLTDQRIVVYSIPDGRAVQDVEDALADDGRTARVQKNFAYSLSQNDAAGGMASAQYARKALRLEAAQALVQGNGIVIAIIDSRIDTDHAELAGAVAGSHDAAGYGIDDADKHGTSIAGIVAARGSLVGVAPGASILAVRAFWKDTPDAPMTSSSEAIARAIDWSVAQGAQLLNLSFTGPRDPLVQDMLAEVRRRGIVAVAAAGNEGPNAAPAYPGALDSVIAVTATDARSDLFAQANRGDYIDLAAPGVDILSPAPGGGYQTISGTSMATAHISGLVALLLETAPGGTVRVDQVQETLESAARDLGRPGRDDEFGAGIVDAGALLADRVQDTAAD